MYMGLEAEMAEDKAKYRKIYREKYLANIDAT